MPCPVAWRVETDLLHHRVAEESNHLRLYTHDRKLSAPVSLADGIASVLGPPPPALAPDMPAVEYGVDAFLKWIWPRRMPDATIFWFNEPDVSYHAFGPFSSEAHLMLAALDRQIGRLIDWWESEGIREDVLLFILSDHGQISTSDQIDVVAEMRRSGFDADAGSRSEFRVVPGGFGQIYFEDGKRTTALLAWLQEQPWCGMTFVKKDVAPGALALADVMYENARAADLVFTFQAAGTDESTPYFSGDRYLGMHGGLSEGEMSAVCMLACSDVLTGRIVDVPSSTADILPTILARLGIKPESPLTGRTLFDPSFKEAGLAVEWARRSIAAATSSYSQTLNAFQVAGRRYIDFGFAEHS